MWGSGYNTYGNNFQRDAQPTNWLNQNFSAGVTNPYGLRPDGNYQSGYTNPFAGQTYGNTYQPYGNYNSGYGGYQFGGWHF